MKQMPKEKGSRQSTDIFQLLKETMEKEKKKEKKELLAPLEIQEFFVNGSITINKRTCRGLECKLCIKACPTNALYWKKGEVEIIEKLCVYCGACVLSCIVDDCIKITRRRETGESESFSKPKEFTMLQHAINTKKRHRLVCGIFPTAEKYLKRYFKSKF